MALVAIEGGFYDHESHAYYDAGGKFVPSVTQIIGLVGLSDYSMVPKETLEAKRRIGHEVHALCADFDKDGFVDPSWASDEARPYLDAYLSFREQRRFKPDIEKVEVPLIAEVCGFKFGVTPDAAGELDGHAAILERKCVAAPLASWAIQTAFQEFALYKSSFCGRTQRFALQLKKDGKYKVDPHTNHKTDASRAIAALTIVWARIDSGEKVWEKV